ncbi:serine carboxypeptidase-like isoform X2 [Papaver somniferum]|uniref:serine carboxypeptidase-like isoform X2 n=1 Tax=Papaver somniferum TaxID=3469 RepID=UPI000E6FA103|nr:serine carboxypeptidase-like isoform X2 [Papaver somniferum]
MKQCLSGFVLILFLQCFFGNSNANPVNLEAEKLIRQLNLFPQDAKSEFMEGLNYQAKNTEKIVEKKFRFPNLIESSTSSSSSSSSSSVQDLGHHAGYYKIQHSHAARMFYFFFESRTNKNDPVVIWLTGGPGCSSELAVFYENGPFTIANNMSLMWNEFGWDKASNLLYVDQPTGTGFSYSSDERDLRQNEEGVSNDLYDFLQAFFAKHPQFQKNDFYITGESYAGHYIPAFASRVHKGNKNKEGIHINLKGFAIGNGLTNPAIQYKAYTEYALQNKLIEESDYEEINQRLPECERTIQACEGEVECLRAYSTCNSIFNSILNIAGDINYYDIRKQCEGSLCYDFSNLEKFLNLKSVRQALGVGNIEFISCSPTVYSKMQADWMKNLQVGIPALLNDGIQLLAYAGEYDLICNWLGNSNWVHAMEWSGRQDFIRAANASFVVDGAEAGKLKNHGPLSFLKVHDAGHMVPMDQPKAALEMLKRWTQGKLTAEAAAAPAQTQNHPHLFPSVL